MLMCFVSLIIGMLMFHMLKGVCGCKTVEGYGFIDHLQHVVNGTHLNYKKIYNDEDKIKESL